MDQLFELTGRRPPVDPGILAVMPSYFLRITTWWRSGGARAIVGITLTPASLIAPWRTEYRYSEPVDHARPIEQTQMPLLGGLPPEADLTPWTPTRQTPPRRHPKAGPSIRLKP